MGFQWYFNWETSHSVKSTCFGTKLWDAQNKNASEKFESVKKKSKRSFFRTRICLKCTVVQYGVHSALLNMRSIQDNFFNIEKKSHIVFSLREPYHGHFSIIFLHKKVWIWWFPPKSSQLWEAVSPSSLNIFSKFQKILKGLCLNFKTSLIRAKTSTSPKSYGRFKIGIFRKSAFTAPL